MIGPVRNCRNGNAAFFQEGTASVIKKETKQKGKE